MEGLTKREKERREKLQAKFEDGGLSEKESAAFDKLNDKITKWGEKESVGA